MRYLSIAWSVLLLLVYSCSGGTGKLNKKDLESLGNQLHLLHENIQAVIEGQGEGFNGVTVRSLNEDGSLRVVPPGDWTSGFLAGSFWYMYELSGEEKWKELAAGYTALLEQEQYNDNDHDMGFRMYCSYGNALRLTGEESALPVLLQSAQTLISRYKQEVGCIRSWDFNQEQWMYPVIIDNMMNLELLFWASEQSGDPLYREIAVQHAFTTLTNHFRDDYSTVHVVDYDTISGRVRQKNTHQGYSDASSWARGQAWGLYGYTMSYRFTETIRFLKQAERIADFLLDHPRLPEDGVPYWDFDAPGIPDEPRDASAAAIMASALYELSTYSGNGEKYRDAADHILESLWNAYRSPAGENMGFLLVHSVGSLPGASEIDVPLVYADYYFLEALVRRSQLAK